MGVAVGVDVPVVVRVVGGVADSVLVDVVVTVLLGIVVLTIGGFASLGLAFSDDVLHPDKRPSNRITSTKTMWTELQFVHIVKYSVCKPLFCDCEILEMIANFTVNNTKRVVSIVNVTC